MTNKHTRIRILSLVFATLLVAAPSVQARELHLRYEAYWSGLHVADFSLSLINGLDTYENASIWKRAG